MEQMCQASEELRTVYLLSQQFVTLLKGQQAEALDERLMQAKECHVSELSSFVNGTRRDPAGVRAAFSMPWRTVLSEGHVNRMHFLNHHIYGRAHLDRLRVKVLHALLSLLSRSFEYLVDLRFVYPDPVLCWFDSNQTVCRKCEVEPNGFSDPFVEPWLLRGQLESGSPSDLVKPVCLFKKVMEEPFRLCAPP